MEHQKSFGPCDDGALAEGYSEAVVNLLAHHWDQFNKLSMLASENSAFKYWVLRHVDSTASMEDLKVIIKKSEICTGADEEKRLCREIGSSATGAIEELSKMK